jgi:HEAT repeat protein
MAFEESGKSQSEAPMPFTSVRQEQASKDRDFQRARTAAVEAEGGEAPTVAALVLALRHESEAVRRAAVERLGGLGAEARAALAALRQARCDPDEGVRNRADRALETIQVEIRAAILRAA